MIPPAQLERQVSLRAKLQNHEFSSDCNGQNDNSNYQNHLALLRLEFSEDELAANTSFRKAGLTKMSQQWVKKLAEILWNVTRRTVSQATLDSLRN